MRAGLAWVAAGVLAGAGTASAQDFRGAELSIEGLHFSDGDGLGQSNYQGGLEFGAFGPVAVAADLSFYDYAESDSSRALTLHAVVDAFSFATLGGFYAREDNEVADASTLGLEARRDFGPVGVEGYLGFTDDKDIDYRLLGVDGRFVVTPSIGVTGSAALVDADEGGVSRIAAGGEYRFRGTGPTLYAEIGRIEVDDLAAVDASGTFVGIGARIAVGRNGGTTFRPRGVNEAISGF